ncbi:hypothetical protein V5N11_005693 [Cardamine amara subsp. amara]|uniref:Uncharacterized protein n=1 Tax=Cardamine amara subsp. amara TaxID=228776 RepID=A0ABD1BE02_CARAN
MPIQFGRPLCSKLISHSITPDWTHTLQSLISNRKSTMDNILLRLAFQATIYHLWRESNGRKHDQEPLSTLRLTHVIDKVIRNRLKSRWKPTGKSEDELSNNGSPSTAPSEFDYNF